MAGFTSSLVKNVTDATYAKLATDYIAAHEGVGFLIATQDGELRGVEYKQTLRQWGAWRAFFRRQKLRQFYMDKTHVYMVPAEWPHLFTTDSTVQQDNEAADHFAAHWRMRANEEFDRFSKPGNEEYRQKVIANALAGGEPLDPIAREKFRKWKAEREPFRPFPKLWEAFANEPESMALLNSGLKFERLFGASKALATQGLDAARRLLVAGS